MMASLKPADRDLYCILNKYIRVYLGKGLAKTHTKTQGIFVYEVIHQRIRQRRLETYNTSLKTTSYQRRCDVMIS